MTVSTAPHISEAKSTKQKALKAYSKFLSKKTIKWGSQPVKSKEIEFAIKNLNNDSIPELIAYWPNASVSDGFENIYTYKNGKIKLLKNLYSESITHIWKKKGLFKISGARQGHYWDEYYTLKKGKLKLLFSKVGSEFGYDSEGEPIYYNKIRYKYYINNKKVKKSKFLSYKKKRIGKAKSNSKYKYHKNNKKNRSKYLSN